MNTFTAIVIVALFLFVPAPADACNSCGGWGSDEAAREAVCASPSAGLLASLHACEETKCAVECATYNLSYDACASAGPPCTITGSTQACDYCRRGTAQWTGIGCETELLACSYDITGCVSCTAWLHGNTNVDNLCEQAPPAATSIDAAIGLSDCACAGGCAADCASSCGPGYLDSGALQSDATCKLCLAWGACSAAFVTCSGI